MSGVLSATWSPPPTPKHQIAPTHRRTQGGKDQFPSMLPNPTAITNQVYMNFKIISVFNRTS